MIGSVVRTVALGGRLASRGVGRGPSRLAVQSQSRGYDALVFETHGVPEESLKRVTQEERRRALQAGEVRVEMIQAPMNPSDINSIEGKYPLVPPLPAVPGNEGVGVVVEAGSGCTLAPGDRVIPVSWGFGSWRQGLVTREVDVLRVPEGVSDDTASMLGINPPTALCMLREFVSLSPGDVVAQNAANSSVGRAVIELAQEMGLRTLNVVRDRPGIDAVMRELSELGADEVVTEGQTQDAAKRLGSAKLALNAVGGKSAADLSKVLAKGGVLVTYGGMSKEPVTIPTGLLIFKDIQLRGYWMSGGKGGDAWLAQRRKVLEEVMGYAAKGLFAMPVERFDFADWKKAVVRAQEGARHGKVVLRFR